MISTYNGIDVHYETLGRGEPLVLLHGWGGSAKSMAALARLLSESYTTYCLDLPGFGESTNPKPDWGVPEYAQCIFETVKHIGIESCHLFGHSFGGSVSIKLAAQYPEFVRSLILCNSAFKRTTKPTETSDSMLKQISKSRAFRPLRKLAYKILYPNSDLFVAPQLEPNFRIIVTQDLTQELPKIKSPTLIIWGEQDTITPISWGQELAEKIPGATMALVKNATHGLPLTQPQLVFQEIIKFEQTQTT